MGAGGPHHEEGQHQEATGLLMGDGDRAAARGPDIAAADDEADAGEDNFF